VDVDESLAQVKRLLGLLPGVELTWVRKSPLLIRIGLAVRDPHSLALLAHTTVASNMPLRVEVAWDSPFGGHDDPNCVRYDLRVPVETGPFEPPSNLQMVGGLLARKLKDRGMLNADEADRLLRSWNFALD
jgi:hypothetical protein